MKLATLKVEVASGSGGAAFRLTDVEAEDSEGLVGALPEHPREATWGCSM
jgi:uncharacterized membrane protein YdbT with pleckstrin-like domain